MDVSSESETESTESSSETESNSSEGGKFIFNNVTYKTRLLLTYLITKHI